MIEERRQKLLESYGIGVQQIAYHNYPKPDEINYWFGIFRINNEDYETDNFKTRREAEDRAIADYESISETGEK